MNYYLWAGPNKMFPKTIRADHLTHGVLVLPGLPAMSQGARCADLLQPKGMANAEEADPGTSAWTVVFCILFLQKMIFGTFVQFWANTVIVAASVLYLLNPALFPAFLLPHEYFTYANAGSRLFSEGILQTVRFDAALTL